MSDFAYILNFLTKYAWNIHDPNNSNESAYGQIAYNAAKLLGMSLLAHQDGKTRVNLLIIFGYNSKEQKI